jgi:hypothetical protein
MRVLVFICPETGKPVKTGTEMEALAFNSLPRATAEFDCPYCLRPHLLLGVHAWLGEEEDAVAIPIWSRVVASAQKSPTALATKDDMDDRWGSGRMMG